MKSASQHGSRKSDRDRLSCECRSANIIPRFLRLVATILARVTFCHSRNIRAIGVKVRGDTPILQSSACGSVLLRVKHPTSAPWLHLCLSCSFLSTPSCSSSSSSPSSGSLADQSWRRWEREDRGFIHRAAGKESQIVCRCKKWYACRHSGRCVDLRLGGGIV